MIRQGRENQIKDDEPYGYSIGDNIEYARQN